MNADRCSGDARCNCSMHCYERGLAMAQRANDGKPYLMCPNHQWLEEMTEPGKCKFGEPMPSWYHDDGRLWWPA